MAPIAQQVAGMVDMLPEQDQELAFQLVKKLVLAWDSNFTKVTSEEEKRLTQAQEDLEKGETISHNEINWD